MKTRGQIDEKELAAQNKNTLWFAGMGPGNVTAGADGKFQANGRKSLANATVQNPVFFTNNIEYAYGYAQGYSQNGNNGYIGIAKVEDLKSINVLDLTDSEELASIFPDCAGSANFYELFRKAEPYFGFNAGKVQQGTQGVIPIPFILARIIITYRNQDRLGMSFDAMYKAFEDILTRVGTGDRIGKDSAKNSISYKYKPIQKQYLSLDQLIFNDNLYDVDFSKKFDPSEYTELYNAYTMAVFKHSIKKDAAGNYIKDETGKYVLTYYGEMFPDDKKNNRNRPVSRDKFIGLSLDHGVLSQKILHRVLPVELSEENVRHINYYLQMTEEIHKWYKNAVKAENITLGQKLDEIRRIIDNDDSDSNSKKPGFKFEKGTASKYIDNLQYMFYYLISKNAKQYQGCYSPEILAVTQTPKKLRSKDATIFLWNTDNIKFIDILNYRRFDGVIEKIDAANDADDKASPFYSVGNVYDDDKLKSIYDMAKAASDPPPAEEELKNEQPRQVIRKNRITADNYREKFQQFKKDIKPDLNAMRSNGPEASAAREKLRYVYSMHSQAQRNKTLSEYGRKYHAECANFLRQALGIAQDRNNASEYLYLRRALEIIKQKSGIQEKRTALSKMRKNISVYLWIAEHPDRPSAKTTPIRKNFTADMYRHAQSLVDIMQDYLEIGELYNMIIAGVDGQKKPFEINNMVQRLRSMYNEVESILVKYPDDARLPEIAEMKEKLDSAELIVKKYQDTANNGTRLMQKYWAAAAAAAGDIGQLNVIWQRIRVQRSEIMLGKIKRYQEKEIKEKVIKEIDEIIVYIKDLIEQAKAGKPAPAAANDQSMKVLWLDDMRDPEKYFNKTTQSETFARNKDFYEKLFAQHGNVKFTWVKSVQQFKDYIAANGLPDMASFDYDLGKGEPKGAEAAKWLVNYCREKGVQLPKFFAHSANRRGREEINNILNSYTGDSSGSQLSESTHYTKKQIEKAIAFWENMLKHY